MTEEKKPLNNTHTFGLLGRNISYSFSRGYFSEKFSELELRNHFYINFDIDTIDKFPSLLSNSKDKISGINVTIPYKEEILPYLDEIDSEAASIGAVNTIKFLESGKLKGFNTDVYGFENSLKPLLEPHHQKALILGTGGASKAIAYALEKLNIAYLFVSRFPISNQQISYSDIDKNLLLEYSLIVNCTPLGTFPDTNLCPEIPYQFITSKHLLFDLIYNPSISTFLNNGKDMGAKIKNGLEMLELQAEKSWQIWNS
jgi:shikimate dehydrogenase